MSESRLFDWVDFYQEFAQKLLSFEKRRGELIGLLERVFSTEGITTPQFDKDGVLRDVDPFTVFALFNKRSSQETRLKIMAVIRDVFGINAPLPNGFGGIPLIHPMNVNYYDYFDRRGEHDIDYLWLLFRSALELKQSDTLQLRDDFKKAFDQVMSLPRIANPKATMGLFWVAPNRFLALDRHNQDYIVKSGNIPKEVVAKLPNLSKKLSGRDYLMLLDELSSFFQLSSSPIRDFKELSEKAYWDSDDGPDEPPTTRYWIYAPGEQAIYWNEFYEKGVMALGWDELGDLSQYDSQSAMQQRLQELRPNKLHRESSHMTWQFANVLKPGDVVFAKCGKTKIVGRGEVVGEYEWAPERKVLKSVRKVKWTHRGEWTFPPPDSQLPFVQLPLKTLTDYTPYTEMVEALNSLIGGISPEPGPGPLTPYTKEDFLNEAYLTAKDYDDLVAQLRRKKNLILQGAPGVGKTFIATRLAYSIMGVKDPDRIMSVQFHQSYSYEDFIMGFRPTANGFELRHGAFYEFCKKAEIDPDNEYFCIIDEINRGNLSKIFGELFMLLESDKRGVSLQLLYANEKFSIPRNVYVIGTMNTADRSLALLDYALRRRFAFYEMKPGFDSDGFRARMQALNDQRFNNLVKTVVDLNRAIAEDDALGEGFCIGHSFFCRFDVVTDDALNSIVRHELIPLLKEYWFDDPGNVKEWSEKLMKAIS